MSDADDSDDLTDRTLIQDDDYSEAYVARNQRFGVEEPQSESVDEPAVVAVGDEQITSNLRRLTDNLLGRQSGSSLIRHRSDSDMLSGGSSDEDISDEFFGSTRYETTRAARTRQRRPTGASISSQETADQQLRDDGLNLLDIADRPIAPAEVVDDSQISAVFARIRNRLREDNPIPVIISSDSERESEASVSVRLSTTDSDTEYELAHSPILSSHSLPQEMSQQPVAPPEPIISPPRISTTPSDFHVADQQGEDSNYTKRKRSSPDLIDAKKHAGDPMQQTADDDDDGMSCPICFESWTNSGKHRLTSLKCGHVFGQKCIERWLKDGHHKCPQCNAKARRSDLRIIYAKKLATLDTTDLERALKDADKERSSRRECEMELAKVRMQYHMSVEECERLRKQVTTMQAQLDRYKEKSPCASSTQSSASNQSAATSSMYRCVKSSVITQSGGCRVMDFHSRTYQFVVSTPSPHASFMSGFGVKRVSASDLKGGFFTILHQKPIKDLRFCPHVDHHLLSASQDGSLRITDLMANAKIHEYKVGKPVWSCCWDSKDRNVVYAGLSNGSLMQYDLRHTSEALSVLENTTSRCPIVSLYHIPPTANEYFQGRGGLLTGTLEGASFWQDIGSPENQSPSLIANYKPTLLPLEPGSCTGLQYCSELQCFLATYRPGRSYRATTHILCEIQCLPSTEETPQISCNVLDTWTGGQSHKMLTRNALFKLPQNATKSSDRSCCLLACVGDEANSKVHIHESSCKNPVQSLTSDGGPPLDIIPAHIDSAPPLLAVLSQNTLKAFQYNGIPVGQ